MADEDASEDGGGKLSVVIGDGRFTAGGDFDLPGGGVTQLHLTGPARAKCAAIEKGKMRVAARTRGGVLRSVAGARKQIRAFAGRIDHQLQRMIGVERRDAGSDER